MAWLILTAMVVLAGMISFVPESWFFGPTQPYGTVILGYNVCCLVGVLGVNLILCFWPEKGDG